MRTARLSKALPPGMSPRLLDADAAAAYLSMSPGYFRGHVAVPGVVIGSKVLWDIKALDRWADGLANVRLTREQILAKLD